MIYSLLLVIPSVVIDIIYQGIMAIPPFPRSPGAVQPWWDAIRHNFLLGINALDHIPDDNAVLIIMHPQCYVAHQLDISDDRPSLCSFSTDRLDTENYASVKSNRSSIPSHSLPRNCALTSKRQHVCKSMEFPSIFRSKESAHYY